MRQTNPVKDIHSVVLRIKKIRRSDLARLSKRLLKTPKKLYTRFVNLKLRYRFLFAVGIIILAEVYSLLAPLFNDSSYALGNAAGLLPTSSPEMASDVSLDALKQQFNFKPTASSASGDLLGQSSYSSALLNVDASKGITTTDSVNKVDLTMTPKFDTLAGRQDQDRIVYPLADGTGWVTYTLRGDGVKEDIILDRSRGDSVSYSYSLALGDTMAAKLEVDGSVGIYGNTLLSGDVATGSDSDAALLQKARANAPKNTLLFDIPAPFVTDKNGPASGITAKYSLSGNTLTVTATGLKKGHYPIAIDPSIYVVTAAQFMAGNNETNIAFDVSNKLIKKAPTTGARINQWNSTTSLPTAEWGGEAAAAGGYIYNVGGTGTSTTVDWAHFNTTTGAIESTNPGAGACSTWCTSSSYNLPDGRANFSLIAYNGFLYAIGGTSANCTAANGTGTTGYCKTVYIAKLGANGEPRLWSPTSASTSTWTYWYRDTDLPSERAYAGAVAYNNHIYFMGGRTASGATNVVHVAAVTPTGQLGTWTSSTNTLPTSNQYDFSAQQYNGHIYVIGGSTNAITAPSFTTWYTKINSDGTINGWQQTTSFTTGRMAGGSNISVVWGAYIYISGGCSVINTSTGFCTTIASDAQVASINADGSLDTWNTMAGVTDARIGYSLVAWQNNIYEVGGCSVQNTSTGACTTTLSTIKYGTVNQDGDASTVGQSVASGTSPCSGGSPFNCNLPPVGTGAGQIGQMLNATAIMGGYLYVIGGCTNVGSGSTCTTTSDNTAYVAISSTGTLTAPTNCATDGNTLVGSWCVDSTNAVPAGIAASGTAVFGGRVYLMGGLTGAATKSSIYYIDPNADGSLDSAGWTAQTFTSIGLGAGTGGYTTVAYDYAYARANPSLASTLPGNIYVFGGCTTTSGGDGCTAYTGNVYKCSITTTGSIDVTGTGHSPCTVTSQLQIGSYPGDTAGSGLGIMSGTVYANYIYLIGGVTSDLVDLTTVIYAKFDNSNNIVAASGSAWTKSSVETSVGRRRGSAFGYNGYLYVVGGFDATSGVLADIEFAKINVNDGSLVDQSGGSNLFNVSSVQIGARWGLNVPVSNSYAYVIGGCNAGTSPTCNTGGLDVTIQTFQLYNNDSGAPATFATSAATYGTNPSRIGVAAAVYNGYMYVAGGCTGFTDCTSTVNTVSYAAISAQGVVGTWSNTSASLPASLGWGKLLVAGGSLYYVGGQDTNGIPQSTVYYGTPSSGNVSTWSTATNSLPGARTRFGAAVWNNRLYVVGGNSTTQNTVIFNSAGTGTFVVPTGITSLTVKAWGAGGGGGNGNGGTGTGGGGGGGGFTQSTLTVTAGASLTYNVGTGGGANTTASYGGNGGGFTALLNGATYLIQAGGGGGGGGTTGANTAAGGNGGGGGGSSGAAGGVATGAATVGGLGGAGTTTTGGAAGAAGTTPSAAGIIGAANLGGDAGGSLTNCSTTVTGRGGNGGVGGGGKGGTSAACVNGGGGGGGRFGGGGGGSATNAAVRGGGAGGGGSDLVTGTTTTEAAGNAAAAGVGGSTANKADANYLTPTGNGGNGSTGTTSTAGQSGELVITYGTYTPQSTVYVSPQLNSGGNITSAWSTASTSFNVARLSPMVVAYANNLYVFGGHNGTNYLSDSQYSQINSSTGNAGAWTYSESIPNPISGGDAFAANGYIYLIGGRTSDTVCAPSVLVAPISANTSIASGNNPTGIGAWFQTNQSYTGARYGNATVYSDGKAYVFGGGCGLATTYASPVTQQTTILSQPQVANYSIEFDTDSDVYPTNWLLNGIDNSIGAQWQLSYQSMTDPTKNGPNGLGKNCSSAAMTTWGQTTYFGNVTLKLPGVYTALDGSGANTHCARYYFLNISVDAQNAFGYPDDVTRGPTITDLTLAFTADPAKRLMHGRTFVGGLQQPDDTPYYTH